ncbi:MAG: hypothetical protein ACFBSF_01095 [Leptolyngbyaceae cyanobacterium]
MAKIIQIESGDWTAIGHYEQDELSKTSMENSKTHTFAILAPVPEQHLETGLEAIAQQLEADPPEIPPVLAFGSGAFEVFSKADEQRQGQWVDMFFYASHSEQSTFYPEATWKATYIKQVHSRRGRYPGKRDR